jgi:hypothetical protein
LRDNLDLIAARLDDPAAWQGVRVGDEYLRIEAIEGLTSTGGRSRDYSVGLHEFPRTRVGDLHDHRWPFAVYPFGVDAAAGTPLYDMPWQHGRRHGSMTVRAHHPYALEHCRVRHAVHGLRPHMSITLTDVTDPATRPNRLAVAPIPSDQVASVLARMRTALGR